MLRENSSTLTLLRRWVTHKLEHIRESLAKLGNSLAISLKRKFAGLQVLGEGLSNELITWPVFLIRMRPVFFASNSLLKLLLEHLALFDLKAKRKRSYEQA